MEMNRVRRSTMIATEERFMRPVEGAGSRLEQIRSKALELFAERGFALVGMRELAQHLGIGSGSIYHHFTSKEQLLFEAIEDLYEDLLEAAALTKYTSGNRFLALLHAHVDLHEHRRLHFLLGEQEFRCLSPEHQQLILRMRRRYEEILLQRLLDAGARAAPPILQATVRGVVAWLNNLSTWMDLDALEPLERCQVIDGFINGALSAVF